MEEKRHRCCKFTIAEEKKIIEDYQNGLSMEATGESGAVTVQQ